MDEPRLVWSIDTRVYHPREDEAFERMYINYINHSHKICITGSVVARALDKYSIVGTPQEIELERYNMHAQAQAICDALNKLEDALLDEDCEISRSENGGEE